MPYLPKTKGFTLIELLIVIALIGILAAGVVIAINPTIRIKQARDAQRKSHINAIANALIGYYTLTGYYPPPEGECDSSIGSSFSSCPAPPTNYWYSLIPLYQAVVDQGFLKNLPRDPINNTTYYYTYFSERGQSDPCRIDVGVTVPCNYYWIGTRLEAPADPTKPVFRCSDFPNLADGMGCKEVGPADLMQSNAWNKPPGLPTN